MKSSRPSRLRKPLLLFLGSLFAAGSFSSCQTTEGFGQDVQKVGHKIENEAAKHT